MTHPPTPPEPTGVPIPPPRPASSDPYPASPPPTSPATGPLPTPIPPTYNPAATATQAFPPYPPGVAVAPPRRRRTAVIVLSILTALFFLASGALGALYALAVIHNNDLSTQVSELNADSATKQSKIESVEKELSSTKRDLADADEQVDEMTKQKKALADCLTAFYDASDALDAANGQRTPEVNAKIAEYDRLCTIAERYL